MKLHFTKMQALGNDFVLLDNRRGGLRNIRQLSKRLCDRRFGIGADQLLILDNSREADFKMRIFNADGSEAEMCGNGIRCLAKHIWHNKFQISNLKSQISKLSIETLAGIIRLQKAGKLIKVDMGEPILEAEKIPVKISYELQVAGCRLKKKSEIRNPKSEIYSSSIVNRQSLIIKNYPLKIRDKIFKITCVSMGNPHAIIIVKDVELFPVTLYGPLIERHKLFPKKTNVEFIQIIDRDNIKMRVWERGVGETMACGTGVSAASVASTLLGLTDRRAAVHLRGGKLFIDWSEKDNHVYMTGPAEKVFEGEIEI